jgi:two-component system sensor histidine kinase HydH
MSAAVLARAFDPFFTTKPDGTGLGLAVATKLLEASGARLSITSSSRGTRAVIQVPGDLG